MGRRPRSGRRNRCRPCRSANAKTGRNAHLRHTGGRAAELRWPSGNALRDGARRGAVFKRAQTDFRPALAAPYTGIYKKEILDKDPHWYEKNIMGSGPFKFTAYEIGQSIKGVRNPDYYHKGLPYLDAIVGIFAEKQSVRVDALRADRAAIQFRAVPPS